MDEQTTTTEEFKVEGKEILSKIKELLHAGNIRKIIIKNDKNEVLIEIPLTFALAGAVIAPVLAAVGAIAALITKCTIVVEKK